MFPARRVIRAPRGARLRWSSDCSSMRDAVTVPAGGSEGGRHAWCAATGRAVGDGAGGRLTKRLHAAFTDRPVGRNVPTRVEPGPLRFQVIRWDPDRSSTDPPNPAPRTRCMQARFGGFGLLGRLEMVVGSLD